jgi:hypothetical protein
MTVMTIERYTIEIRRTKNTGWKKARKTNGW